ncbi:MAG TPA: FecR domain-containing protein, partial [Reyranellaceae bacterium]|nr:FecR domain-containing protein [Reyranellaceae bacterium]
MVSDTRALDDAIGWLVRQQDPAFADWASFTEWLEADPRNAAAYAELSARDAEVAEHLATIGIAGELAGEPLHVPQRNWTRRGFAIGGAALAASIVAVVGSYQLQPSQSLYSESTPPGVQRTVTLAGGATIGLNGGTHVVLDRRNPRFAELRSGEASFDIVHDADDPFRVVAGGAELVDLGTRFNVAFERGELEVGVSEGVVMYNPG